MIWIFTKVLAAILFILVPGFELFRNYKERPFLTLLALLVGLIAAYSLFHSIASQSPKSTESATFKLSNEKESGWDTRVGSRITSTVKTYLDKNYSGWTLASSKQCFNEVQDPVQLYGDFDGDGVSDFAIRIYHGMELYLFAFLSSGGVHMIEREFGSVANPLTLMKKGTRDYEYENNQRVLLPNDGITVNICEQSAWTYVYIDGKFTRLWTSD